MLKAMGGHAPAMMALGLLHIRRAIRNRRASLSDGGAHRDLKIRR